MPESGKVVVHYEVDQELHQRAKVAAARLGMTLKQFLEQALDEKVRQVERKNEPKKRR